MGLSDTFNALAELWAPATKFTTADIPDLAGKVIIVTGGNSGIGKEIARALVEHNAKVYIACRSPEKAQAAIDELLKATGKSADNLKLLRLDLGDLAIVKSAAEDFLKRESRLDVLIQNAGVMWPALSMLTAHGQDLQFGTNVLGHFYFTQLLLPTLISAAASSPDKHARVVNVASNLHWSAPAAASGGPILYDTIADGPARQKLSTETLYAQSKAGNVLFSHALARKYGPQGIISITLNPGFINTEIARHTGPIKLWILRQITSPIPKGALTPLYAAVSPEAAELNGKYLVPWARVRHNRADLDVEETQEKLWTYCEEQVKELAPAP